MKSKPISLRSLQSNLERSGLPVRRLDFSSGTVLVLPHGGRVIGLFPRQSQSSFLWTHDALRSVAGVRRLYAESRWPNPGGDRTWLAPTTELFVSDLKRFWETWREPVAIDPGNYVCRETAGRLHLVNHATVELRRLGQAVEVEMEKSFEPAPDPLRYEPKPAEPYAYAGYTTRLMLKVVREPRGCRVPIGLWQLLQLPPGGEVIVATHGPARTQVIFGEIPAGHLRRTARCVRYRMASPTTAKIAIRGVHLTGRMGYVRRDEGGQWELVIRNFFADPSGEYVDTPFDNLEDRGDAMQACNVAEKDIGRFCEMEHHVPAVGADTGRQTSTDVSQVWAFRGSRRVITLIAGTLLGCVPKLVDHHAGR
jgi:hypothetical protein